MPKIENRHSRAAIIRWARYTPKEKSELMRKAVNARWEKYRERKQAEGICR